jgi:hypothetical protein
MQVTRPNNYNAITLNVQVKASTLSLFVSCCFSKCNTQDMLGMNRLACVGCGALDASRRRASVAALPTVLRAENA